MSLPSLRWALAALFWLCVSPPALAGLTAPDRAEAAQKKERVTVGLPDAGQLTVARLEFKLREGAKPRLGVKAANAGKLPAEVIAAVQGGQPEKEKGRAAIIVSVARTPGPPGAPATGPKKLVLQVDAPGGAIDLSRKPDDTGEFANVLGPEGSGERLDVQDVFEFSRDRVHDDATGAIELKLPRLRLIGKVKTLVGSTTLTGIPPRDLVESGLGAAIGPPAALHSAVYGLVTGQPIPQPTSFSQMPAPGKPEKILTDTTYGTPVIGAQASQTGSTELEPVLDVSDPPCDNDLAQGGTILTTGPDRGTSDICNLPVADDRVLFDLFFVSPPPAGTEAAKLMPIPAYPRDSTKKYGEAIAGPGVTAGIG